MKQAEITGLSIEELRIQVADNKKRLEDMTMNHAVTPLDNPMQIRTLRRTVARLSTELTKREKNNG
jgi:large subunit ribosomal protein L29